MSRHSVRTWVFLLFALAFAGHISGQSNPVVSPFPLLCPRLPNGRLPHRNRHGRRGHRDARRCRPHRVHVLPLFVTTSSPDDQLSAVFGNIDAPAALLTTGDFFQSFPIGDVTASGSFPPSGPAFPSNQFDSFVTIGMDQPADAPAAKAMCSPCNPLPVMASGVRAGQWPPRQRIRTQ